MKTAIPVLLILITCSCGRLPKDVRKVLISKTIKKNTSKKIHPFCTLLHPCTYQQVHYICTNSLNIFLMIQICSRTC
jgi:hypothetical protein